MNRMPFNEQGLKAHVQGKLILLPSNTQTPAFSTATPPLQPEGEVHMFAQQW